MSANAAFLCALRRQVAGCLLLIACGLVFPARGDDFAPRCLDAAPGFEIIDLEVDGEHKLATWMRDPVIDFAGNVVKSGWITVAPLEASGRIRTEERWECHECDPFPFLLTKNGPEFSRPLAVYFTAYSEDRMTPRLGRILPGEAGWEVEFLPYADDKMTPVPTLDSNAFSTRLVYFDVTGSVADGLKIVCGGWREDTEAADDHALDSRIVNGRFTPGDEDIICARKEKKTLANWLFNTTILQPGVHSTETGIFTPLLRATDVTRLGTGEWPNAWRAPELYDEVALVTVLANTAQKRDEAVIWKKGPSGKWIEWTRVLPPNASLTCFERIEPFVFKENSYLLIMSHDWAMCAGNALQAYNALFGKPAEVWITSVDPQLPADQRVSRIVSDNPLSSKTDAEIAIMDGNSVKIYYQEYARPLDFTSSTFKVCESGL